MKRKSVSFLGFIFMFVMALGFASCKEKDDVKPVAITVAETVAEGTTLLDVMEKMQRDGELSFELSDGMITKINCTANDLDYNPCWMLFTSDGENSNAEWGTYVYDGETLGSATLGAESLLVKTGELYVWVYQGF